MLTKKRSWRRDPESGRPLSRTMYYKSNTIDLFIGDGRLNPEWQPECDIKGDARKLAKLAGYSPAYFENVLLPNSVVHAFKEKITYFNNSGNLVSDGFVYATCTESLQSGMQAYRDEQSQARRALNRAARTDVSSGDFVGPH